LFANTDHLPHRSFATQTICHKDSNPAVSRR
jgi:hypothetical protein